MNKKKESAEIFSPPRFFLSHFLCFESLLTCSQPLGFLPCTVLLLTDNSGSRVPSNGSNQLASRVPGKRMVKGKRLKERQKEPPKESQHESSKESQQEPPKESPSVQTLPPKKKKEKAPVAHTSLPTQPAHPPPIKDVPSLREHNSPSCKGVRPKRKRRRIESVRERRNHHPNPHRKLSWTRL